MQLLPDDWQLEQGEIQLSHVLVTKFAKKPSGQLETQFWEESKFKSEGQDVQLTPLEHVSHIERQGEHNPAF